MALSDEIFVAQFEDCSLAPEDFNHLGHLRLGWLYLRRYPLAQAIEKVTGGIQRYAESLGATAKFQYTLTEAIVRIMAARMVGCSADGFDTFIAANPDLVDNMAGLVAAHYSPEVLYSERARNEFVCPDLAPLPTVAAA